MKVIKTIKGELSTEQEMKDFFKRYRSTDTLSNVFESVLRRNNVQLNCENFDLALASAKRKRLSKPVLHFIESAKQREEELKQEKNLLNVDGWIIDL